MVDPYNSNILRVAIAQICESVGYDKIQASSLVVVQDALHNFLRHFCRNLHAATEHANRTEANFKDLLFCFGLQNISVGEILGFLKIVDSVPCAMKIYQNPLRTKKTSTLIDMTPIKEVAPPQTETEAFTDTKQDNCLS